MSVSALVVSYHTGDVLWRCLDTALSQCDEVVVVDNGNPPEATGRLRDDPRIRYVESPGNVGFAWGNHLAAQLATGDHLLVLNPDAVLKPGCVERLRAALAEGATLSGARLVDGSGRELRGSRRRELTPFNLLRGINLNTRPLPEGPFEVGAVSGACLMIGRADWDRLGGFDPAYFLHVEDLDLCRRVRDTGGSVVFVPDAQVEHAGATSAAPQWVVETHKAMGFKTYLIRHYPIVGRLLWPAMSLARRARTRRS